MSKVLGQCGESVKLGALPMVFNGDVVAFDISGLAETLMEFRGCAGPGGLAAEITDHRHSRLLRLRYYRPRRRASKPRNELSSLH